MAHDFVKAKLPRELRWGQNIDFTLEFPEKVRAVIVTLRRIWPEDVDSKGRVKDERQARQDARVVSIDYATPRERVIDLSAIPPEPTRYFVPGIYFVDYVIKFKDGKFSHGSKLYRGLQKA